MLTALWVIAAVLAAIPFSVALLVLAWHAVVFRASAVSLADDEWSRLLAAMAADRHEELQPPG